MRLETASILPAAILAAVLFVGAGAAAAEPPARTASYKAPVVASLSADEDASAVAAPRARALGAASGRLLGSPGGQLATTVAVFVCAMFLASLGPRRS